MAGFRAEAKMSTWLVRIVVNESLGRLRRQNRRAEVVWLSADGERDQEIPDEPMSQAPHGQPERDVLRSQTRRLIEASIDKLPDSFRTVFVLRAVEEFSVEETAQALGIPAATVRTRFFRARSLLRDALAREIEFCIDDAFGFAGGRCDRIVANVLARIDEP
jgi:RNA polymerase sigma-70 factor (ECF subfamily)